MMSPHSNPKFTVKKLLRRIAPPQVVYRTSLIPAIASEFDCSNRTVQRKMKEAHRHHFITASKNGRLALTQKGVAFIEGELLFFDFSSSPPEEPPLKGSLIDELTNWGSRSYTSATATVKRCRHRSSCDCDTPLIGVSSVADMLDSEIEQAHKASRLAQHHPKKLPNGRWVMVAASYRPFWPILAKMPRLSHWPDRSLPFDNARSEVVQFAMRHCGVDLATAVRILASANDKEVIVFDPASKTWTGVKGGRQ